MSDDPGSLADLAANVRLALEGADPAAFGHLLDPAVRWGPPDDAVSGCHNRDQVIARYVGAKAQGMTGQVVEVVPGRDALLVGMLVNGTPAAEEAGGTLERWQVLAVRHGRIVDIRGYPDRAEAAARAGVLS
jgi:hypothetical protein